MALPDTKRAPRAGSTPLLVVALALVRAHGAMAQDSIVIDPARPVGHWLAAGTVARLPGTAAISPVGLAGGNIGWFDYSVSVPEPGWRRLVIDGRPHVGRVELALDPLPVATFPVQPGPMRPGDWVWLSSGTHRIRVSVTFWTGLPQITGMRLDPPAPRQGPFHVLRDRDRPVTALHHCPPIHVLTGGGMVASKIRIAFARNGETIRTEMLTTSPASLPGLRSIAVPCDRPGDVTATLVAADEPGPSATAATVHYSVFDTRPVAAAFHQGALIVDINAARQDPDFTSGQTAVVHAAAGDYRESSTNGTQPFIRKSTTAPPAWFAYRVENLIPGHPYVLDIEYPDDATRVFVATYRDQLDAPYSYPASLGVETGGVWPTGQGLAHRRAYFWPKSGDGRIIVYNMYSGQKAAVARIRIYAAHETETPAVSLAGGARDVAIWYEEGLNFKAQAGVNPNEDIHEVVAPVERYLRLAQSSGASVVWPGVNVYTFQLYPSRINLTFNDQDTDLTAAFLLGAQRYGLKVVPELHPRADELVWPPRTEGAFRDRLLLSGDGATHYDAPDGHALRPPFYNAINPDVREWYINLVGEVADRYKDYPALGGIALRVSDWQNPALNNLVSLEWGYDAATVARFVKDSGLSPPYALTLPGNAPDATRQRRAILTGRFHDAWEQWRCRQIHDILRDVVRRVRQSRADLKVHLFLFGLGDGVTQAGAAALRGMGIDTALLAGIDGLVLVDGRFGHGASEATIQWQQALRSAPRGSDGTRILTGDTTRASTLSPMRYLEITPAAAPRLRLGWSDPGEEPWISAASEPPGRLRLARYAEQVGLFDVYMLGDGGNGYVFDDADTREFFAEFRSLPRRPFTPVAVPQPGIVVRKSGAMFYMVNLTARPIAVRVSAGRATYVKRAVGGASITLRNGAFSSTLGPYALMVYHTDVAEGQLEVSAIGRAGS